MKEYGPFALRLGVGGIFVFAGLMKLLDPNMIEGMLGGMGFPVPAFWTWILILSELLCGVAVLTGFKLKYTTVPLMVVMIVASVVMLTGDTASMVTFPLLTLFALVSLWFSGPGALALSFEHEGHWH